MSETQENTFTSYLGHEFQQRLIWQLLVEPEFAEKTIPQLAIEYFDDFNVKRLYIIMLEFMKEFEKVPNLQNKTIHQAINKYKTPNNIIEEESLFGVIKRIELWNERVINKELLYDGDIVQKSTIEFIKQQEYRKLAEFIIEKTKSGEIRNKNTLFTLEEKIQKISNIGDEEDYGTEVIDDIENVLRKEFRETIPTGVEVIDALTGGGLGKGEIGIILAPTGTGKSTLLTKIANTAYELGKNVLQIIFEDTEDQIKRKHYTIWSGVPLSKIDEDSENVKSLVYDKVKTIEGKGKLVIKKFSQENTTMMDIRNWMVNYQKKWGIKFEELVLDYLDCVESHKRTADRNEAELIVVKSFDALASDFNIPSWTAIQGNRLSINSELVEAYQSGGNIKRIQKAHFVMSIAKTPDQKEANFANIRIIKARFAQDGQTFMDCIFNNDSMQIIIEDDRYSSNVKKYNKFNEKSVIEKVEEMVGKSTNIEIHTKINENINISNVEDKLTKDPDEPYNSEILKKLRENYNKTQ